MDVEATYSRERMSFHMGEEPVTSSKSSDKQSPSDSGCECCTCTCCLCHLVRHPFTVSQTRTLMQQELVSLAGVQKLLPTPEQMSLQEGLKSDPSSLCHTFLHGTFCFRSLPENSTGWQSRRADCFCEHEGHAQITISNRVGEKGH